MTNGKGSKSRPAKIPYDKYADNWDSIFNKKKAPVKEFRSWEDIEKGCKSIVKELKLTEFTPDYIVGLTRGGLIPAVCISHLTGIPMHTLNISLRDGDEQENKLWMSQDALDGKKILIVDDINDSGETINTLKKLWAEDGIVEWGNIWHHSVRFAVIDSNSGSKAFADYIVNTVDKVTNPDLWLVYPWEIQE